MKTFPEFLEGDRFAAHCGIELVSVAKGRAVARMTIGAEHLNAVGIVQGGAIFTLADFAFAAASNSHGTVAVAVNVSITFMKSAATGTLTASAREISLNPKLGSYAVDVTDEAGNLIATFQGLVYRKSQPVGAAPVA